MQPSHIPGGVFATFTPNKRTPIAAQVSEHIRQQIMRGFYLPGVHLVESELTETYGVSRVTIREALRALLTDELVELIPHRGVRVRRLSPQDVRNLYVVRRPLESLAASLAAQMPADRVKLLHDIHVQAESAVAAADQRAYLELNNAFHRGLAEATDNQILIRVLQRLNVQTIGYQYLRGLDATAMRVSQQQHEEVLAAIGRQDPAAAEQAMQQHIASSQRAAMEALGQEEGSEGLLCNENGATAFASSPLRP